MNIRQARAADIPALVRLRMALFCEVGELISPDADPSLFHTTLDYFTCASEEGSALSWVAEFDHQIVAAGTLALFVRPPYPGNLAGREAYLLNMYTLPAWRARGIATALLDAMTAHARAMGLGKVWLHASDAGRPLYERIGFVANPAYMEWQSPAI
ncbi:GNAT family N-acetyltransferase [Aeromonas enteropelogenes]|uniref:GNAT family N-acetyltransferase n=1 Tax=Aeromonas enteropelogenes TaxID=29489 RepID=UPI003B9F8CF7